MESTLWNLFFSLLLSRWLHCVAPSLFLRGTRTKPVAQQWPQLCIIKPIPQQRAPLCTTKRILQLWPQLCRAKPILQQRVPLCRTKPIPQKRAPLCITSLLLSRELHYIEVQGQLWRVKPIPQQRVPLYRANCVEPGLFLSRMYHSVNHKLHSTRQENITHTLTNRELHCAEADLFDRMMASSGKFKP